MKEIKDIIHLYLGCRLKTDFGEVVLYGENISRAVNLNWKPILRPLSSMTEEELIELNRLMDRWIPFEKFTDGKAEEVRYLLSKHFDLFNLIESGLAIDKNTLK